MHDQGPDEGFTMVEVVVAFMLFTVLAATAGLALTSTLRTSVTNENRVVAANLAAREIETVRGLDASLLEDGDAPQRSVAVDGRTYYLDRTTTLDVAGGTGSACSGASGPAAFKRVTVTVSWDRMDGVDPVRSDTLKALGVSGLTGGTGVLAVAVQDRTGTGVKGLPVTLGARTSTTQADGCAVFAGVAPGAAYTVSVTAAGWVGRGGAVTAAQTPVSVLAGQVTKAPALVFDKAAGLALTVPAPTGYPVPDALALSLSNTDFPVGVVALTSCVTPGAGCVSGTGGSRAVSGLFPSTNGYGVWPGFCSTARPTTPTQVAVSPGTTATATTTSLGGVAVVVKKAGVHSPGYGVRATNASCATEAYDLPGTSGTGDAEALRLALPPGTWNLQTTVGGVPTGTPTSTTVVAGAVVGAGTPVVVVNP